MQIEQPEIFRFEQYRPFIKAWLDWKKKVNPSYSTTLFSKKAGISAHTLLGMVIRGERNLSYKTIRGFCKAMDLKAKEALYFEKLVQFNQSEDSEDKAYFLEQLLSVSSAEQNKQLKTIQNFNRYLSHWYFVAIREMVHLPDFKADAAWICQRLKNKITKAQAEAAWSVLLELGMIEKNEQAKWTVVAPTLDIDPGFADFAIRNFHKEYLERTRSSIDEESISERELSSLTMSLSEEDFKTLKEELKEFRKKINLKFPQKGKDNRSLVVAINMQCLKLTEQPSLKEKKQS